MSAAMWVAALTLALVTASPALSASVRDCRLVQKPDSWFTGGVYAAAISDGTLRMLLIRRPDGPSTAMDFALWKGGNSVHTEFKAGDSPEGQFWLANTEPNGRITVNRWHLGSDDAASDSLVFDCPLEASGP